MIDLIGVDGMSSLHPHFSSLKRRVERSEFLSQGSPAYRRAMIRLTTEVGPWQVYRGRAVASSCHVRTGTARTVRSTSARAYSTF